jgi:flagellar hook-basal body complex protein FliE
VRKTLIVFAAFLCISAIASCSSDSKKTTTTPANNNSSSSSASSSSGNGNGTTALGSAEFCGKLSDAFNAVSDQNLDADKEALQAFRSVEPPSELSGVWDDFLKALDELSKVDQNDDQAKAQVAVRHAQSLGQVSLYIGSSCTAALESSLSSASDSLSS